MFTGKVTHVGNWLFGGPDWSHAPGSYNTLMPPSDCIGLMKGNVSINHDIFALSPVNYRHISVLTFIVCTCETIASVIVTMPSSAFNEHSLSSLSYLEEDAVPRTIRQDHDLHHEKSLHIQHILKGLGVFRNSSAIYWAMV